MESLQEYGRGVAGGLLFSLPLLYTMEVWLAGSSCWATTAMRGSTPTAAGAVRGSVIICAVRLVASAGILWVFGRFDDAGTGAVVGQTVALAAASTLGASAGKLLLQGGHGD